MAKLPKSVLLLVTFLYATNVLAQCGGDSGSCCVSKCPGGCLNNKGETMCNQCLQECDLTVCVCGCFDTGLQCNAGQRSGLGDTQAMIGLGVCGLMLLV